MNMLSASIIPFLYSLYSVLKRSKYSSEYFFLRNLTFWVLFFILAMKLSLFTVLAYIIS